MLKTVKDNEVTVLGLDLCNCTPEEGVNILDKAIESGRKTKAMIVNAACVNISFESREYRESVRRFDVRFVDGVGIYIAGKILRGVSFPNLAGSDFGEDILKRCVRKNYRIYFLGAKPGIAEQAMHNLRRKYPKINIVGTHHGYFNSEENNRVIEDINSSGAEVLIVCFGKPREVIWIDRNFDSLNIKLAIPLGAFFDFQSGNVVRAPLWIRKIRFEWFYRLVIEPRRLWKRYVVGNMTFISRVLRYKLNGRS
ncbi:MAG: WecB/TagA/CpsF family glycosyltransferase [candidate division Zixibacteria bacterium]|nr:WecB/TagA/CpsF family glycosyltransferase [candidate division Zixibacteria bacterium]